MSTKFRCWWPMLLCGTLAAATASAEPKNFKGFAAGTTPADVFSQLEEPGTVQKLLNGVTLKLSPGAQAKQLPSTDLTLGAPGGGTTRAYVFQLTQGRLDVTIPEGQMYKVAMLIVGPKGESAVAQAGHNIAVLSKNSITFGTATHPMLTGKGSRWRKLTAGNTRSVEFSTGKVSEHPMPAVPNVQVDHRLAVAMPGEGFQTKVQLQPVDWATQYQIALLKREGSTLSLVSDHSTATPSADLRGSGPGEYVVVARALDAAGVASNASSPTTVRVMSVELPPGAEAKGQTVVLHPSQRVSLVAADGLKMTYGGANYFVDAPNSVGLAHGEATTVRFQEPTTKQEVALKLAPNVVNAQISIGPSAARWPEDAVTIKVRFTDGAGKPVAKLDDLETNVSVNLEATEIKWKRGKGEMVGVVRPPVSTRAPWVVRVEAKNQLGQVVGRDFLEVVSSEPAKTAQK